MWISAAILVVVLVERSPVCDKDCDEDYDKESRRSRARWAHIAKRLAMWSDSIEHLIEHPPNAAELPVGRVRG